MNCVWKVQYRRRKLALTRANMVGAKFQTRLFVYKCPECGFWHLTHVERRRVA